MKSKLLTGVVGVFFMICIAEAAPVEFTFSGTGTGIVDNTISFTDTNFEVHIFGDTDCINTDEYSYYIVGMTGFITIDTVGNGDFTNSLYVFAHHSSVDSDGKYLLGFGAEPCCGDLISLRSDNPFSASDLKSNSGPFISRNYVFSQFYAAPTTMGSIGFTSMSPVMFTAKVDPVPVPAAAWLLGSGLVGLVGVRRKIKK